MCIFKMLWFLFAKVYKAPCMSFSDSYLCVFVYLLSDFGTRNNLLVLRSWSCLFAYFGSNFCFVTVSNMANPKEKTPMCLVNELARFNKIQPEYKLLCEQGPAHSKVLKESFWQTNQSCNFIYAVVFFCHKFMLVIERYLLCFLCFLPVRFSQLGSHWEISTGRQRGPASRKPSIPLLHLPSLRRHFPSPPWGRPATQARTQVGSSHWLCRTFFLMLVNALQKRVCS